MRKVVIFGLKDDAELSHESDGEAVAQIYPPQEFHFFASMSPKNINKDRGKIHLGPKAVGYKLISYVSSKAATFDNEIGDNCFILEDNTIQPFTRMRFCLPREST